MTTYADLEQQIQQWAFSRGLLDFMWIAEKVDTLIRVTSA